ncbi:hypothetical protein I79_014120 [Cricetulus griseus]|uniref:Uncharacterized protein n=1 Tax=Cricetulus griseus TaxID=10029 RepID=G3HT99_CRIGR|nr:hypothetical protein I79_014120 [Cricetulus griseus]
MRWRPAKTCLRKEQGQGREGLSVLESASSSGIAGDPGACGWARGPAGPEGESCGSTRTFIGRLVLPCPNMPNMLSG